MGVCENKLVEVLQRWCDGPGIADAREPSVLIKLCVGHLAHPSRFATPILPVSAQTGNIPGASHVREGIRLDTHRPLRSSGGRLPGWHNHLNELANVS